jgi:hypothetical protein
VQALGELIQLWRTNWSALIDDKPIRDSALVLTRKTHELLPGRDKAMQYPESEPAAKAEHFERDLQELIVITEELGWMVAGTADALLRDG